MNTHDAARVIAVFAAHQGRHQWDEVRSYEWLRKLADLGDVDAAVKAADSIVDQQQDNFATPWGQFRATYDSFARRNQEQAIASRRAINPAAPVGIVEHLDWLAGEIELHGPDKRVHLAALDRPIALGDEMSNWATLARTMSSDPKTRTRQFVTGGLLPFGGIAEWFENHPEHAALARTGK